MKRPVLLGGLSGLARGPDQHDLFRRSKETVAKALAGAKPADLPVERPTRILRAINMKTAAALGVTFPQGDPAARRQGD